MKTFALAVFDNGLSIHRVDAESEEEAIADFCRNILYVVPERGVKRESVDEAPQIQALWEQ